MSQTEDIQGENGETQEMHDRDGENDADGIFHLNRKPGGSESSKDARDKASRSEADMIAELEAGIAKAENEAKTNYDRFLRASAEFENYKKRAAREMDDFRKYANESLVKALLPVIDNLERAIATSSGQEANACIIEGIELTLKDILKVLEKFNVSPVVAHEAPFDPAFHQAVMQEATDAYPENTVIRELQKGYLLNDRLIRPAMVVVSKSACICENNKGNE